MQSGFIQQRRMQNGGKAADGSESQRSPLDLFLSRSGSVLILMATSLLAKFIMKLSSQAAAFFVLDLK